jgi:hypothetical protein
LSVALIIAIILRREINFFGELMKSKVIFLFFLLFISNTLNAGLESRHQFLELLPKSLKIIQIGKTPIDEIVKNLGPASLVEKDIYYYEENGFKYSLQFKTKNKKVFEYSYTFSGKRPSVPNLKSDFKNSFSHGDRFFKLKEEGMEILIDPIELTVYSIKVSK